MGRVRRLVSLILWLALTASVNVHGQSLGDVARQSRQKQSSKGDAAKKVITNEDIPESPDAHSAAPKSTRARAESSPRTSPAPPQSTEQVKSAILEQKHRIASQQDEIDRLNRSIYFYDANLFSSAGAARHNEVQVRQQEQVEYLRTQLAEQQKKLVEMRHAAMDSGMGSVVYDP